jgi:hypothetical protein
MALADKCQKSSRAVKTLTGRADGLHAEAEENPRIQP